MTNGLPMKTLPAPSQQLRWMTNASRHADGGASLTSLVDCETSGINASSNKDIFLRMGQLGPPFYVVLARILLAISMALPTSIVDGDVYNWQTGEVILGTEGITPRAGVDFWSLNNDGFDLSYADFSNLDLRRGVFDNADLSYALFDQANLQGASLEYADLTDANFTNATLEEATLRKADLSKAVFDSAFIRGVDLWGANLSQEQLYSTASYRSRDLRGIEVSSSMRNWDLAGQDLSNADLWSSFLGGADLTGAIINGTALPGRISPSGTEFNDQKVSEEQLYSTASYQVKNLQRVRFIASDLTGFDFRDQDLRFAWFDQSRLAGADFSDADLRNTLFDYGPVTGLGSAIFNVGTVYNQWTSFPTDFDPVKAGLTYAPSSPGDFDLNDVLDAACVCADNGRTYLDDGTSWQPSQCSSRRLCDCRPHRR